MAQGRVLVLLGTVLVTAGIAVARADNYPANSRWYNPYVQDPTTVQKLDTYGYYGTRWRKWPASHGAVQQTGPASPIPTPAVPRQPQGELPLPRTPETQERTPGTPDTQSDELGVPDELEMPPSQQPSTTDEQPDLAPLPPGGLPGELPEGPGEESSQGPGDLPQPQTQDLEGLFPDAPATPSQQPSTEPDAIPNDEDPFKDEPDSPTSRGAMGSESTDSTAGGTIRWRRTPRFDREASLPVRKRKTTLDGQVVPAGGVVASAQTLSQKVQTASHVEASGASLVNPLRQRSGKSIQSGPAPANGTGMLVSATLPVTLPPVTPAVATVPNSKGSSNPLRGTR